MSPGEQSLLSHGTVEMTKLAGPESYLSICSEPATDWVSRHIGLSDFSDIARRLTVDVMRNEKLEQAVHPERAPDPSFETAWKWTTGKPWCNIQGNSVVSSLMSLSSVLRREPRINLWCCQPARV